MAVGCLSGANEPAFEGVTGFERPVYQTGEWPHHGVDFTGLRVGVVGTGSSAIQAIPPIARQAESLAVFQRTPNYAAPAWNQRLDEDHVRALKADYPALRAKARGRPTGFHFPFNMASVPEASEAERQGQYRTFWDRGGLPFLGGYGDLLFEKAANDTATEFARAKIRAVVQDPATAELLCPQNVFGCKRLCLDSG